MHPVPHPLLPLGTPSWLIELATCPSTNTWAIAHLSHLRHGTVIWTRHQTAGRGQQGRVWQSPPGVLTASIVLCQIPAARLAGASLVAGLSVIYALEALLPSLKGHLGLKWPNDVVVKRRKLAGILCEAKTRGSLAQVVVGIGLNRCGDFSFVNSEQTLIQGAISLHHLTPQLPSEMSLLEHLRSFVLEAFGLLQRGNPQPLKELHTALRKYDALLGQVLTLDQGEGQISGEAVGLGDRGDLLLRLENGKIQSFTTGHVLLRT